MKRNEESTLAILFKVLDDVAWQLEVEHLDYLFDKLRAIPLDEFNLPTVDLMKEMSRFTYKVGCGCVCRLSEWHVGRRFLVLTKTCISKLP